MFEILATLGRTMGFSFGAGINLYATVAILGLAKRYGWVDLPEQFRVFDNDVVIVVALVLYVVEFVADKVPWVDSVWDAVHTVIRPIGGAVLAVTTFGDASPAVQGLIALLGGALATGTHLTKAGTRAAANTSPEPFSNWALSLVEDVFVIGLSALALKYPIAAGLVVILGVVTILIFAAWIVRALKRRWGTPATVAAAG
jgi:nicotinamide riboside transporter PnuC